MSDERIDIKLREVSPRNTGFITGLVGVVPRLWQYLKDHFPLFTNRAGAYADAKVEQERGEAERLHAEAERLQALAARERAEAGVANAKADLISATADAVRAQMEINLTTLAAENARLIAERDSTPSPEALITAAKEQLRQALAAAEVLGITLSLEQILGEDRPALPRSIPDSAGDMLPQADLDVED